MSDVAALQTALAAEHAAVYGYGVLGSRLRGAQQQNAMALWVAHKARRDRLSDLVIARGGQPVAAQPAYALPLQVTSPRTAAELAGMLEGNVVAAYVALAGAAEIALRHYAVQAMQEATVRQVRWTASPPADAFPGLPQASLSPSPDP